MIPTTDSSSYEYDLRKLILRENTGIKRGQRCLTHMNCTQEFEDKLLEIANNVNYLKF